MNKWIVVTIAGTALATYLTRFPLMLVSGGRNIPEQLKKFMSYIGPAILTALIVPSIFTSEGRVDISLNNYYVPAAAITVLVAYFSKSMLASIITGLCTVGLLMWMF